jgi:hypothetical protein
MPLKGDSSSLKLDFLTQFTSMVAFERGLLRSIFFPIFLTSDSVEVCRYPQISTRGGWRIAQCRPIGLRF